MELILLTPYITQIFKTVPVHTIADHHHYTVWQGTYIASHSCPDLTLRSATRTYTTILVVSPLVTPEEIKK